MFIGTYCKSVRWRSRKPATATTLRYPVSAMCRHQSAEAKRISMYKPRQYLPISARVDFRILLRLVFKVRIKCEELPEVAVLPFGVQAVEEQAFGSPKRIDHGSLPGGEIGLFQFTKSIGAGLPRIGFE